MENASEMERPQDDGRFRVPAPKRVRQRSCAYGGRALHIIARISGRRTQRPARCRSANPIGRHTESRETTPGIAPKGHRPGAAIVRRTGDAGAYSRYVCPEARDEAIESNALFKLQREQRT